jgi:2-enoate reductase
MSNLNFTKMLVDAGYDALNRDSGTYDSWFRPHPQAYMSKSCNLEDLKEIKKIVDHPELANDVIGTL